MTREKGDLRVSGVMSCRRQIDVALIHRCGVGMQRVFATAQSLFGYGGNMSIVRTAFRVANWWRIVAVVVAGCVVLGTGTAHAQPDPPIDGSVVDKFIPAPRGDVEKAIMPSRVPDSFFWRVPSGIDGRPGEVLQTRDVTASGSILTGVPGSVRRIQQLKFATRSALGAPTFGTATVIVPQRKSLADAPMFVYNTPIDSLGSDCTPGYAFRNGYNLLRTNVADYIPPFVTLALQRGYVVVIPDHEGPRMAYGVPALAGRIVLDAIRATRNQVPELQASRFAMTGYSGGAIATNAAARMMTSYAPELVPFGVGAASGGNPVDADVLIESMSGTFNFAKGMFAAVIMGHAREYPEILTLINNFGLHLAPVFRDICLLEEAPLGSLSIPLGIGAKSPRPYNTPIAEKIKAAFDMKGAKSAVPMMFYQGDQEWWIPAAPVRKLFAEQCRLGVRAVYVGLLGEHAVAALSGALPAWQYLDARLQGKPAPNGCRN